MEFYNTEEFIKIGEQSYNKQIDCETTSYECFFHYSDKELYLAGYREGFIKALEYYQNLNDNQEK